MKAIIIGSTILLLAAAAVEPLAWPWQVSLIWSVAISSVGSLCDEALSESFASHRWSSVVAVTIMSTIAAIVFFSVLRFWLPDSLQIGTAAGICGIYGRRGLQRAAESFLRRLGADERN